MSAVSESGLPFAHRALEQLREWPALNVCRADCGAGTGLAVRTRQIVHLHRPDEAELYLTWPVLERLSAALSGNVQVRYMPGSDRARVRLECDTDVTLLASLVSVAIQANSPVPRGLFSPRHTPCPQSRGERVQPRVSACGPGGKSY